MKKQYGLSVLALACGFALASPRATAQEAAPPNPPKQEEKKADEKKPEEKKPPEEKKADEKQTPPAADPKDAKARDPKDPASKDPGFTTDMPKDLNDQPEFIVGPGDGLMINVWKEPEVSQPVTVRGDCRITLQLIKDVEVCGMTPTQIQNLLTEKLSKYLTAPDVTVTLSGLQSRKVYFIGQVRRPGAMVLNGPMSISQALSDAGGLADYANDKKVIIQRMINGVTKQFIFNYRDYLKGKNPQGNILLMPGDIIMVR